MSRALITGIGGQDGSLLAELLLERGYEVVGVVRPGSTEYANLEPLGGRVELYEADLLHQTSLAQALLAFRPNEVYNLAAPSFVPASWERPVETAEFAAVGATAILEAIRIVDPTIRFYQASSSEIFGDPVESPQTEATPPAPVTPYGVAKAYAHFIVRSYRRRYGMFACSGILYNHESPRRPLSYVPRKIANGAAARARRRPGVTAALRARARRHPRRRRTARLPRPSRGRDVGRPGGGAKRRLRRRAAPRAHRLPQIRES